MPFPFSLHFILSYLRFDFVRYTWLGSQSDLYVIATAISYCDAYHLHRTPRMALVSLPSILRRRWARGPLGEAPGQADGAGVEGDDANGQWTRVDPHRPHSFSLDSTRAASVFESTTVYPSLPAQRQIAQRSRQSACIDTDLRKSHYCEPGLLRLNVLSDSIGLATAHPTFHWGSSLDLPCRLLTRSSVIGEWALI